MGSARVNTGAGLVVTWLRWLFRVAILVGLVGLWVNCGAFGRYLNSAILAVVGSWVLGRRLGSAAWVVLDVVFLGVLAVVGCWLGGSKLCQIGIKPARRRFGCYLVTLSGFVGDLGGVWGGTFGGVWSLWRGASSRAHGRGIDTRLLARVMES